MQIKKFLVISLLIVVFLLAFYLIVWNNQWWSTDNLNDNDHVVFSDNNAWESYQKKYLEQDCPFYQPDGATYRKCLFDLLTIKEKNLNELLNQLGNKTDDPDFKDQLKQLGELDKPYRDKLCKVKTHINIYGSNYDGLLTVCKIYETDKLANFLKEL